MDIERFTPTELKVLEALGTYRFLTAAQMMRLGVTPDRRHLYRALETLAPPKRRKATAANGGEQPHAEKRRRTTTPVAYLQFGVLPTRGKLGDIYFLTPHGAKLLAEAHRSEAVEYPARVRVFGHDYFHRVACVDAHITIRAFAARTDATVDFLYTYFDHGMKEGPAALPKTYVPLKPAALVPDIVFQLKTRDGNARLFALEVYNRRETGRVEKQLERYLAALEADAFAKAYQYPYAVRILCLFEDARAEELVHERLPRLAKFSTYAPHFFFKTQRELAADFLEGWRQAGAPGPVRLFGA